MDIDDFTGQFRRVLERVAALHQRADRTELQQDRQEHLLQTALAELDSALEELRTVGDELRQQNEELLATHVVVEAERQRYQDLFEFAPDGYLVTDYEGRIKEANHAAAELLRVPQDLLVSKPLFLFIASDDLPDFVDKRDRIALDENLHEWELQLQPLGGPAIDVAVRVSAVRNQFGQLHALRWLLRDITAHKQAEVERAVLLARAEEARSTAEAAVQTRDQFLSVASHELKTPLTSLLAMAQLLQRRIGRDNSLLERDRRAVQVIAEQSARLNALITSMLDISRLELGQLSIEREPLDLRHLCQGVVADVQPTIERHSIDLQLPESPVVVMGDVLRLEQVIANLLQNAIKYSPSGGLITVWVTRHDGTAHVRVTDQGIGIPAEAQTQLFTRFYRADNVDPQQISGMGIGLYVIKEIVTMHNGTVSVESNEGAGSTFTVTLPLHTHA